jgi:glycine/D-amino acid oxidase-like deaminating enzyme
MKSKIVIVGGGVMGLSIAHQAARRCEALSEPVVLFERGELGAGSSGRSGAILRQFYADRETAGMARDCLRFFGGFQRNTGRSVGFRQTGVLTLVDGGSAADRELLEQAVAMMSSIGIEVQRLDAAEIREAVPGIVVDDGVLGAFEPKAGLVDAERTIDAFGALAREAGAVTRVGVAVERIAVEGGRVTGVETSEGFCETRQVVVAAGPWSRDLLAAAGVDLPLTVVRPENAFLGMPAGPREEEEDDPTSLADVSLGSTAFVSLSQVASNLDARFAVNEASSVAAAHPVLLDVDRGAYVKCEPDRGRTRVGRMTLAEDQELADPDALDEAVDPRFVAWARERVVGRLPVYAEEPDVGAQAAWYTMTPDAQAVIGPAPGVEGLWVVTGFSGHGFKLSPAIGEGVAQMVFGDKVSAFDPAFFAPERFAANVRADGRGFGL